MTWNLDSCFVWKVHQGNHTRGWGLGGTEIQERLEPGKDDIIDPCTTGKRMSQSFARQIATEYLSHAGWQEDSLEEVALELSPAWPEACPVVPETEMGKQSTQGLAVRRWWHAGNSDLPGAKRNEEMRWEEGWKVEEARVEAQW